MAVMKEEGEASGGHSSGSENLPLSKCTWNKQDHITDS